jgi:hypothetical protein
MHKPVLRTAAFAGGQRVMSRFLSNLWRHKRLPWERIGSLAHAHNSGVTAYLQTFEKPCSSMQSREDIHRNERHSFWSSRNSSLKCRN